jgi:hypothetical protein
LSQGDPDWGKPTTQPEKAPGTARAAAEEARPARPAPEAKSVADDVRPSEKNPRPVRTSVRAEPARLP